MSASAVFAVASLGFIGAGAIVLGALVRRTIRSQSKPARFFRLAQMVGIVLFIVLVLGAGAHIVTPDSPHSWTSTLLAVYAATTSWAFGQGDLWSVLPIWIVITAILFSCGALAGRD
jgi:hypothetical protein